MADYLDEDARYTDPASTNLSYFDATGHWSVPPKATVPDPEPTPTPFEITPSTLRLTSPSSTALVSTSPSRSDAVWSSKETRVATVAGNGSTAIITAVADGSTSVTATSDGYVATCEVVVRFDHTDG